MDSLFLWKWRKNNSKVIIGPGKIFPGSETFAFEWDKIEQLNTLNPLKRPIPPKYDLYIAKRSEQFPYNTISIRKVDDLFYPSERGIYFLSTAAEVQRLKTLV